MIQIDYNIIHQTRKVITPRNGNGDIPDRVFHN